MNFSNGYWLHKEGHELFGPSQIYYIKRGENKVVICAPTHPVTCRDQAMDGVNLTIEIAAPCPGILHMKISHFAGNVTDSLFRHRLSDGAPLEIEETEEDLRISSGKMTLCIRKDPFMMRFLEGEKELTRASGRDLALVKTDWRGYFYDKGDEINTYIRQRLLVGVDEMIYGLGERFTPFVKNGQTVDIWNEDGGTSSQQAYKNIPFYLSSKGYGVFVNHTEKVSFEVASETVNKVQFSVEGSCLDYYVIGGDSMKEVLMRYTDLTGKPSLPPAWSFGLWLSTSFVTDYDEQTVMSFIDGMLDRGIPLRVFHFDCYWMREFSWCEFMWDAKVFPDPPGMLRRIKEKGLKICVWINPYVGQESAIFKEGHENGYFLKKQNGRIWQWDMWQPGMAIIDFTNPAAAAWYQSKLEKLLDMGVDCFKTDFGERIPTNVAYYDGSDPVKMHNYYTYLYNQCVYQVLERKKGKGEAVLFARSATAGSQQFPVHWGGDCFSDYESMEQSIRGGLSLQMSGFGYWAHDIGGFEGTSSADVYKRWVAFGLLSSHSRLHGSHSYRVPWAYDEEAVDVVRFFTRLKARLMPYLYSMAVKTSRTGIPMMRSMVLEYPRDRNCRYLDKQYFLGDSLLVAPVFNDRSRAVYYLPEGRWTNFFSGELVESKGSWREEHCGYCWVPLWVKEGSVVALGSRDDRPDYEYDKGAQIRIYEPEGIAADSAGCEKAGGDRKQADDRKQAVIYDMHQECRTRIETFWQREGFCIKVSCKEECSIRLVNRKVRQVICQAAEPWEKADLRQNEGEAAYQIDGADTVIALGAGEHSLLVSFMA